MSFSPSIRFVRADAVHGHLTTVDFASEIVRPDHGHRLGRPAIPSQHKRYMVTKIRERPVAGFLGATKIEFPIFRDGNCVPPRWMPAFPCANHAPRTLG